jgi:hypothetical protein
LAFVLATWAIFWCGWDSLQVALPLILLPSTIYILAERCKKIEFGSGVWWFVYLLGIGLFSYLIGSSRIFILNPATQLALLSVFD